MLQAPGQSRRQSVIPTLHAISAVERDAASDSGPSVRVMAAAPPRAVSRHARPRHVRHTHARRGSAEMSCTRSRRHAALAAGRRQRSASALGGPAGAPAHCQDAADQPGLPWLAAMQARCRLPRRIMVQLSATASRSPCARRCAIGYAEPRPGDHSQGIRRRSRKTEQSEQPPRRRWPHPSNDRERDIEIIEGESSHVVAAGRQVHQ